MTIKITREKAIQAIDRATDRGGYDDWWGDLMDDLGLYDERKDELPSLFDILAALGVTKDEYDKTRRVGD